MPAQRNYGGKTFGWARGGIVIRKAFMLPMADWQLDATNPPTASTAAGTTPTNRGLLFDATTDLMSFTFAMPFDYAGGDVELHLFCINTASETASDLIEWTCNYITYQGQSRTTGLIGTPNLVSKTSSSTTCDPPVLGALSVAADHVWDCILVLPEQDANNPLSAQEYPVKSPLVYTLVTAEINRTTVGGAGKVANVLLIGAAVEYDAYGDQTLAGI